MTEVLDERKLHAVGEDEGGGDENPLGDGTDGGGTGSGGAPGGDGAADQTVAQVPEVEQAEPKPTPPMQIPLPGINDAISNAFGGKDPEVSEIKLLGGKMPIEGSFDKGSELDLLVRVKVTEVAGLDVTDDWGKVERTIRRHRARLISVRRANR